MLSRFPKPDSTVCPGADGEQAIGMVSEYFLPDPEWAHKHPGPEMLHSQSLHQRQDPDSRVLKWHGFFLLLLLNQEISVWHPTSKQQKAVLNSVYI